MATPSFALNLNVTYLKQVYTCIIYVYITIIVFLVTHFRWCTCLLKSNVTSKMRKPLMNTQVWVINYIAHRAMVLIIHYSTGVQIVSCTLSDDSVLSESTGLFNPVLCVSQWNLFWQKNQPMRLCLSNQVRSAREWFPSPLGDFIRLFEGLIGELFQIWNWNMFYFFKWHQSGP